MKKALLFLAIAAGSALQAQAQLINTGFEASTADSINGWNSSGEVKLVTEANFTVNGQPQKQIPYDGSTKFVEIRPKLDSGTSYFRGSISQSAKNTYGRPVYFQFVSIYLPQGADRMAIFVTFTKHDTATNSRDTVGTGLAFTSTPGASVYPWTKFGSQITYKSTDTADSVHVTILANAASATTLSPNAVLYIDDFRFEDRNYLGLEEPANLLAGTATVYPNPMRTNTTIAYSLTETSRVSIDIYDLSGRLVKTVLSGTLPKGDHKTVFERDNLNAGMYIYKLQAGSQVETGKILIQE